jgi:hypothetical protein
MLIFVFLTGCGAESTSADSSTGVQNVAMEIATEAQLKASWDWGNYPPDDVGLWLNAESLRDTITLNAPTLHDVEDIPDMGYVPVESMGYTVRVRVNNERPEYVADIRVRITAISQASQAILAEAETDVPGSYGMTLPCATQDRVFVLDRFDDHFAAFGSSSEWPPFKVSVTLLRARLVSDGELLKYHRERHDVAAKARQTESPLNSGYQ